MQFGNNGVQIDRQMFDLTSKVTEKIHECEHNIKEINVFIPEEKENSENEKDFISFFYNIFKKKCSFCLFQS